MRSRNYVVIGYLLAFFCFTMFILNVSNITKQVSIWLIVGGIFLLLSTSYKLMLDFKNKY